jgi:diazepam-binding inhibitor (GABA receptor modulator, acyl-CoA-binding protein)
MRPDTSRFSRWMKSTTTFDPSATHGTTDPALSRLGVCRRKHGHLCIRVMGEFILYNKYNLSVEASMSLDQAFETAQQKVQTLTAKPGNDTLLALYALYKQATQGNVSGGRPGIFDLKGQAKYDAWAKRKGQTPEACKKAYVELVEKLLNK